MLFRQMAWGFGFLIALAISAIVTWTCWRFGSTYGGITGDLEIDGYVMAALDVLKVFLPAAALAFWHRKSWMASMVCWTLAAVLVAGSLYTGITMAGYGRSTAMAQQTLASTQAADLRSQLAGLQRQLDALGDPKPVDGADADLKRHASSSAWAQANNCNLPVPGGFQRFCAEYQRLMSALAASQSSAELQGKMEALRVQLAEATTVDAVRPANPAWEAIERVTGWRMVEVTTVWALVLMLMLEAFSATIPSAMLRTFPRGQASLPARVADAPARVPAEVAQALPESPPNFVGDNAPLPPKPRGEKPSTSRVKRSPKPSPEPADTNSGRPRFAVVEGSPSTTPPSPTVRNIFQQGDLPAFLATLPIEPGREMRFSNLREAHKKWAATVGRSPATDTSLGMALRAAGFVARKTGGVMVYRDCRRQTAKSA
jgi:hypothetical protein